MTGTTTLKRQLDEHGIKQTWLAQRASLTPSALNLIVNGRTLPTLRTAQRIARALKTTVEELWPLEETEP